MPLQHLRAATLILLLANSLGGCGAGSGAELIVQVVNARDGRPIPAATATFAGQSRQAGPAGLIRFLPPPGSYPLDVGAQGYFPRFEGQQLHAGKVAFRQVALEPMASPGTTPLLELGASGGRRGDLSTKFKPR